MSLKLRAVQPIPPETVKVAQAAFPKGNTYMKMRDELGVFFSDGQFASLFPSRGQPALSPWRLALVTIMQFAENLTDRQAADAVRGRIDWKYTLGLELTDPGFNFSVLSEFRDRLIEGNAEHLLFERMLNRFQERDLLKAEGRQRTDSTHILSAIRTLSRLELVTETLIHTLNVLATVAPHWLKTWVPAEWFNRYEKRITEYHLPEKDKEREAFAQTIGIDGHHLLSTIYAPSTPDFLREIPAVETLRQIFLQQYYVEQSQVYWREKGNTPPAAVAIPSPHDTEARYTNKRDIAWVGYKVHLTETCDEDLPHLITSVNTTVATDPDNNLTQQVHNDLDQKALLPKEHLVDGGYASIDLLRSSKADYDIDLICPMRPDNSWQGRTEGAFDISQFAIDWQNNSVTCPKGRTSQQWKEGERFGQPKILVRFRKADCQACPSRHLCTQSRLGFRELTFSPKEDYQALQQIRKNQHTPEFKQRYNKRAGVEGTISCATNAFSMRKTRYRGLAKTHLQHVLTACAININRVVDWFDDTPRAQTRTSRFATLAA